MLVPVAEFIDRVTASRSPVLYLHPDEVYLPAIPPETSFAFREACKTMNMKKVPATFDPSVPVYYSAFLDRRVHAIAITFWCFYNFSQVDVRSPAGFPDVGAHEGDWEWLGVVARTDPSDGGVDDESCRYYVGQHAGGLTHETVFVDPSFEDRRPVFFVARKSHSNYVDEGVRAGIELEIAADRPVLAALYALSRPVIDQVTWDHRKRGHRWQPPVRSITSQPWFLNRGQWGNQQNSPCSPIVQMHKPHARAGVHTPVAFRATPANLKFQKGTTAWQRSPGIETFETAAPGQGDPGHHAILRAAPGAGPACIWQEMVADTRDGDVITARVQVRFDGDEWSPDPVKLKIVEQLPREEKHSETKFFMERGAGYDWHATRRVIEHDGPNRIRFEVWVPGGATVLLDRVEIGVRCDGLVSLEPGGTVKSWNEMWFGRR